ncbi:hypothetical protein B0T17DRAFT_609024 [Bombardia bombarda]|uniref:Accumulation-associated protein n=1 Tax=Bombardia bombarda TaxID=252184 RepID=A0AA39WUX2_9PEZI|nr:hypothetical protein B0T17DRAFT_609024 [Bombardia bombarda]
MKLSYGILIAAQALSVMALPSGNKAASSTSVAAVASSTAVATATATSAAPIATPVAGGEEEKNENEVEQAAEFGVAINLGGGDIKTDTTFPPGKVGVLEVEFQNTDARVLRVTENKTPGNAPVGFTFLEPSSYKIELGGGSKNLTLSKVDYISNADNTVDISTGQIGRLCTETNTFVVGAGVGELEFEVDENELTLTVDDMVGEWGIFIPTAAAATPATGAGTGATTPATGTGGATTGTEALQAILDKLLAVLNEN